MKKEYKTEIEIEEIDMKALKKFFFESIFLKTNFLLDREISEEEDKFIETLTSEQREKYDFFYAGIYDKVIEKLCELDCVWVVLRH